MRKCVPAHSHHRYLLRALPLGVIPSPLNVDNMMPGSQPHFEAVLLRSEAIQILSGFTINENNAAWTALTRDGDISMQPHNDSGDVLQRYGRKFVGNVAMYCASIEVRKGKTCEDAAGNPVPPHKMFSFGAKSSGGKYPKPISENFKLEFPQRERSLTTMSGHMTAEGNHCGLEICVFSNRYKFTK